jgi:hypothetical protein
MNADDINAALEDAEQAILRKQAKNSVKQGGPAHYFSSEDTFDRIPGGMVARRNNHTKALLVPPDDPYGISRAKGTLGGA